jgi:hypothetical protein
MLDSVNAEKNKDRKGLGKINAFYNYSSSCRLAEKVRLGGYDTAAKKQLDKPSSSRLQWKRVGLKFLTTPFI